jgi:L-2,4-diaminobutyrate decarboxylase
MATPPTDALLAALDADTTLDAAGPFLRMVTDYFAATGRSEGPVSTPLAKPEVAARFDEPMPMGMRPLPEVAARLEREVLRDANHLMHPMYLGHQVSAPLAASVWSEVVISALNNSMAVWEMSPTATVLEERVISWMTNLVGWGPAAAGTMTSGGTEATFSALLAARAAWRPDAWTHGFGDGPTPVVLCGEQAHYAVQRAVGAMGLGTANCLTVSSDGFRMSPSALTERLDALAAEGRPVLAVVATVGQTATGTFDDLEAIGAICEARGIWLHVDGAHGATALLSLAHRHRVQGIQRARSVAWDPHKMMLLPLSAGMLLVREGGALTAAFAQQAPYLFHGGGTASPDLGTRSFQCSRRADVVKLWVALQRLGADGIGALYDHLCGLTRTLYDLLAEHPERFELPHQPESNILCFRVRGSDEENLRLREAFNRSGQGWITTTVLAGRRVLRVTVMNPRTGRAQLVRLLQGLGGGSLHHGSPLP